MVSSLETGSGKTQAGPLNTSINIIFVVLASLVEACPGSIKNTMMGAAGRQQHVLRCLGNQICDNPTRQSLDGHLDFTPGDEGTLEYENYHNPDNHSNFSYFR